MEDLGCRSERSEQRRLRLERDVLSDCFAIVLAGFSALTAACLLVLLGALIGEAVEQAVGLPRPFVRKAFRIIDAML